MKPNQKILLKNISIYTENMIIDNGFIKVEDGKIKEVGSINQLSNQEQYENFALPAHFKVIPGFIDVHIHGVNGADTMDASKEALETMSTALPEEGTTSFLATTITQESEAIEQALLNASRYIEDRQSPGKAEILGVHLEGPFVNPKKAGAQPVEYIVEPNLETFIKWQQLSKNTIKLVTLAPEQPGGLQLIQYLKKNGVIASIGHSDATYEKVSEAIAAGATHVTHLFNQMTGLHHREPGVAGAALLRAELKAEIIADGVHVRPEMVNLVYKQKGQHGLILITDAMRAKCLNNGTYDLGGQDVTVKDGKAVLRDGTLAGSILKMGQAVKNIVAYTDCTLESAIKMGSVNPAKQLNVFDRKGSIAAGKDADLVIFDENHDVVMTFCKGMLAFSKEVEPQ
ncbi:N-acetylglucosamine-6-phosphate deacetylase [Peribacillus cavernae]|uniref:N-acetylglucosamine-6-phosphate deacetylase n=1 Tax=Peribacillus cavernae TaxID=1674310 RepID=A0A433HE99_9BACI|nr:N-acetylglucosamine-6-phosphate deacetylase [Peribacillus cavernae]MDQ0219881.1 N-acetylglucosamine-6-phosphate deacetylase [Peribacillus cavernae]RUQ26634.1 N-acetylglucosamine-6-phosphate deacetylase [Peribacillus cavernae]